MLCYWLAGIPKQVGCIEIRQVFTTKIYVVTSPFEDENGERVDIRRLSLDLQILPNN